MAGSLQLGRAVIAFPSRASSCNGNGDCVVIVLGVNRPRTMGEKPKLDEIIAVLTQCDAYLVDGRVRAFGSGATPAGVLQRIARGAGDQLLHRDKLRHALMSLARMSWAAIASPFSVCFHGPLHRSVVRYGASISGKRLAGVRR
jgi:hypothetical protein